ncbi:MAG: DUF721 domain-containing protein [Candidatus Omnitrophica bacterium]|nr:DUF721 domain-containing protein [Candidatus Omnitrophota bacterium]
MWRPDPQRIGEIIPGIIEKIVKGKPIRARGAPSREDIVGVWKSLIGEETAAHARIKGLKKGTLHILIDSSPHLSHLLMEKERILTKLKEVMPGIREIKFRAK